MIHTKIIAASTTLPIKRSDNVYKLSLEAVSGVVTYEGATKFTATPSTAITMAVGDIIEITDERYIDGLVITTSAASSARLIIHFE